MAKCLNPDCKREQETRGLCGNCYTTARELIQKGDLTWELLEREGAALPKVRHPSTAKKWLLGIKKKGRK